MYEEKGLETLWAKSCWFRILHLSVSFICFCIRNFSRLVDNSEIAKQAWKHIRGNVILSSARPGRAVSYTGLPLTKEWKKPEWSQRKVTMEGELLPEA